MLYLISTPIGNLKDFSFRAIETLKQVDYVLCEDTRHSGILLSHYEIKVSLKSFHKFNESSREDSIIEDLRTGKDIAVISDAGTPGIADPAAQLVQRVRREGLEACSIPGACALICALSSSGMGMDAFQFVGFAPRKEMALEEFLRGLFAYAGTSIFYESPKRILATLTQLAKLQPECRVCLARELTKRFEEVDTSSAADLLARWEGREVKGELVVLVEGRVSEEDFSSLDPEEHVTMVERAYGISRKDALKLAAKERGITKRDLYRLLLDS